MREHIDFCAMLLFMIMAVMCTSESGGQVRHADHDLSIGDIQVRMLQDAQICLRLSLLAGIDHREATKLNGGSDSAWIPVNAYLVRMPNQIVLVDAGVGKHPGEDSGHLLEGLKKAGVNPAQVDLILLTHFHFDHIGGLVTPEGKRVFPKAIVRASKAESDFWMGDSASVPEKMRERASKVRAIFAPYVAAKAFRPFTPDEDLGHGIRVVSAYGHTPGHTVYAFSSKGKELWCIGDLIHFGDIQFEHPSAGVVFDSDGPKAIAARLDLFKQAAASHIILAAAHLPAMVQLEKEGEGFVSKPVKVD